MNDEGYSTGRRRYGMLVYVIDDDKLFRLFPYSGSGVVSLETFTATTELAQVTMLSNNNGWVEVPDLSVLITGGTYFSGSSSIVLYDSTGGTVSITGITTTDVVNPGDGRVLVSTGNSESIFVAQPNMVFNGTNLNITGGTFITDSGGSLHSSAIIQFKSTTKGVLLPGMTTSQKNAIVNPTTGLTVYDSTIEDISVYTSSGWTGVIAERDDLQKVTERGNTTNRGLIISGTTYIIGSGSTTGNTFVTSNSANTQTLTIKDNGNVLIGTTTDAGYKLDVNGVTRVSGTGTFNGQDAFVVRSSTQFIFRVNNDENIIIGRGGGTETYMSAVNSGRFLIQNGVGANQTLTGGIQIGTVANYSQSTGTQVFTIINPVFNPTGYSDANFSAFVIAPTINQSANPSTVGLSRGLYINPTLVSSKDFRAIETTAGKVIIGGSITAASLLAQGVYFNNTLVAAANNDVLVGLDINPTFTNGSFTGVTNWGLRSTGLAQFKNTSGQLVFEVNDFTRLQSGISAIVYGNGSQATFRIYPGQSTAGFNLLSFGVTSGISTIDGSSNRLDLATNSTARLSVFTSTGNVAIGTQTDAGYKLGVNGSTRIVGSGSTTGNTFVTSNSANTQTFTIKDSGNVLIGTTTDGGEKLYVNGNTSVNGNLQILNNGGLTFYNGASIFSSHYITTSNELLTANSNNSHGAWKFNNYYVSISKNLAVGTTLTDFVAPSQTFLVLGSSVFSGSVISSGVTRLSGQTSIIGSGTTSGSTAFSVQNSTGGTLLNLFNNGNLNIDNGVLYVDGDNGRVGIGTTTPSEKLSISAGNMSMESGRFIKFNYSTPFWIGADGTANGFTIFDATASLRRFSITTVGNVLIGTTTDAGYKLDVNGTARVQDSLTVDTDTLYVDATNNRVGIGTTSPTAKLHIKGFGDVLLVDSTTTGSRATIKLTSDAASYTQLIGNGTEFNIATLSTTHITFGTNNSERLRIFASTGNVGINTTTDAGYRLDVSGTTRIISTGSTSGSTTLTLQNSTGRTTTEFRSDGVIGISSASTFTTQVTSVISASTTNSGIAIVPNGTGAFTLSIPDGTDTGGGNARGQYAVDLKLGGRTAATQVASGNYSAVIGGDVSTASGLKSLAGGSAFATGTNSVALGGSSTASGSGSVAIGGEQGGGLGATASGRAAIAFGLANTATADFSNSLGGLSNSVSGSYSSVVGGQSNTSSASNSSILGGWLNINTGGSYGSIGGGRSNVLSTGSWYTFIGGGWNNGIINGDYSVVVGGFSNSATTQYAAVIGGSINRSSGLYSLTHGLGNTASSSGSTAIGYYNTASGGYSIAMGSGSTASGLHSTVSGGYNNRATGVGVFIGGGVGNSAGGLDNYQTIVGGNSNTINAAGGSFIGGGQSNTISNGSGTGYCVIVGGLGNLSNGGIYNTIGGGNSNTASASHATVVGGLSNTASGVYSIVGGSNNTASGQNGVAFGDTNTASGQASFAANGRTQATTIYSSAFGFFSQTYLSSQQSLAGGVFAAAGDAQQSLLTARRQSSISSGQTTSLSLDGSGTANLIIPNGNNRAWNVVVNTITVCTVVSGGTLTVGDAHSGEYKFLFKRVGGTSTISPITTSSEVADTSMGTASYTFSAGTSQQLAIVFNAPTTANNSTFRAVAKVALTEVAW
jgi:hypothetical protein